MVYIPTVALPHRTVFHHLAPSGIPHGAVFLLLWLAVKTIVFPAVVSGHYFFFIIFVFMLTSEIRPPYCFAYSFAADMPALLYAKWRVFPSFVTTFGIIRHPMLFASPLADRHRPKANGPKCDARVMQPRDDADPQCFGQAAALALERVVVAAAEVVR